jgi:hypothetical protein
MLSASLWSCKSTDDELLLQPCLDLPGSGKCGAGKAMAKAASGLLAAKRPSEWWFSGFIEVTTPNVKNSTLRVGREIRWDQVTGWKLLVRRAHLGGRLTGTWHSNRQRVASPISPPSDGSTLISPGTTRDRQPGGSRRGTFRLLGRSRQHTCDSSALAYYS